MYVNASLSKEYIYAGAQLVATLSGNTPTYVHPGHLSTRLNTNSTGVVTRTFGHYPFGETWYESSTDKWKFTSYERDAESGLDYAMFRFDSPRLGRFQSPDPLAGSIGNPQSLNRYGYTLNDPVNLVDPLGLYCLGIHWFRVTCITDHAGTHCELEYLGFDPWFCFGGDVRQDSLTNTGSNPSQQNASYAGDKSPGSISCDTCISRAEAQRKLERTNCNLMYYGKKAGNLVLKGLHILWQYSIPGPVDQDWEPGQGLGLKDYDIDACLQRAESAFVSRLDFCHAEYCGIDKGSS